MPPTPPPHPDLLDHSREFSPPQIKTILPGVHVAIGYDLANVVLIEGESEAILVDTLGSREAAVDVRLALKKVTSKPIRTIIYTHNHADHIFGAGAFIEDEMPRVIAHALLPEFVKRFLNVLRPSITRRSMRQFGIYLEEEALVNAGIGPRLRTNAESTLAYLPPTETFEDRMPLKIDGVQLELIHAPGETDDTTYVWLPGKNCLISADNIYKTFPNLYAIRGTPYRDVMQWVRSLDQIRSIAPEVLIPTHGQPLVGHEEIHDTVTAYRDAIQYIHDQTIRSINLGLTADQIAHSIELPEHLANHRYLRQHYGTIEGSVRSIFDGYLGWFSGNPAELEPLPPKARAERMARLAGGVDQLERAAAQAEKERDFKWLLELTDHLSVLDGSPEKIKRWRILAMRALAENHLNANHRNYYLMAAMELEGFEPNQLTPTPQMLSRVPIEALFETMRVRLNPEKAKPIDRKIVFEFTDSGKFFTAHVRRGVLEVTSEQLLPFNAKIITTEQVWKEMAAGLIKPGRAILARKLWFSGNLPQLIGFLGLIDR